MTIVPNLCLVSMEVRTSSTNKEVVEETQQAPSLPHIVIGTKFMQVGSTHITMDTKENPLQDLANSLLEIPHYIPTLMVMKKRKKERV